MAKFSKILIFIFLTLAIGIGVFAISHFSEAENGENIVSTTETLFPEILANSTSTVEGSVYVCPKASSMEEINPRCEGRIDLRLGETINGMTLTITNYEGQDYYMILGFVNGGAGMNLPPMADANGPYQGDAGLPITLDATNSSDPNGDPLQYRWDFDNDGIWDTEWLSTSTTDHIWNIDYEGIIKLEVSDGEFASFATSLVKIKSPRTFKQDAIAELEAAKIGDKKTDREIDKIIWLINKSLDENLWFDASHLVFFEKGFNDFNEKEFEEMFNNPEWTGPKTGIVVFHYEKAAVELMMNEIKSKKTPDKLKQDFEEVIQKLTKSDILLAQVSIYDAKNTPVQNPKFQKIVESQIKKAEEELAKAEKELSKNRPDKAITRFAKSWLHSQLAIKFASLSGNN